MARFNSLIPNRSIAVIAVFAGKLQGNFGRDKPWEDFADYKIISVLHR